MKDPRSYNVGKSDYSKKKIQPWSIWIEYDLNPFDADIVKRVLRTKEGESRILDYKKIIHVCEERIRQLQENYIVPLESEKGKEILKYAFDSESNVYPDHCKEVIKKGYNKEEIKEELKKASCPQYRDLLESRLYEED